MVSDLLDSDEWVGRYDAVMGRTPMGGVISSLVSGGKSGGCLVGWLGRDVRSASGSNKIPNGGSCGFSPMVDAVVSFGFVDESWLTVDV